MGISLAEAFGVFDKDGSGFITISELEEGLRTLGVFEAIPREQVRKIPEVFKASKGECGLYVGVEETQHCFGRALTCR